MPLFYQWQSSKFRKWIDPCNATMHATIANMGNAVHSLVGYLSADACSCRCTCFDRKADISTWQRKRLVFFSLLLAIVGPTLMGFVEHNIWSHAQGVARKPTQTAKPTIWQNKTWAERLVMHYAWVRCGRFVWHNIEMWILIQFTYLIPPRLFSRSLSLSLSMTFCACFMYVSGLVSALSSFISSGNSASLYLLSNLVSPL